jgi:hypothetical protein
MFFSNQSSGRSRRLDEYNFSSAAAESFDSDGTGAGEEVEEYLSAQGVGIARAEDVE